MNYNILFQKHIFLNSLKTDFIGRKLVYFKKIDSTNIYSGKLIKKYTAGQYSNRAPGEINGTLVLTEEQTSGKGRLDRKWLSPPGGLWFTLILLCSLEQRYLPFITLVAAKSIHSTLIDYNIDTLIKWPNDVYYNDHKLGGILCESEKINGDLYLTVGIGLNINLDKKQVSILNNNAISAQMIIKNKLEREIFLSSLLNRFEKDYIDFCKNTDIAGLLKELEGILVYSI